MNIELWDVWDGKHDSEDQKKRLSSAKKANMTPISIDTEKGEGKFSGSTAYTTTLSECTCIDFKRRQLPCKHMYRLAIELGIIQADVKSDKAKIRVPKSERVDLSPIIEIIESISDNQRNVLHDAMKDILFKCHGAVAINRCSEADELISHGILVISNDEEAFFMERTRSELIKRLDSAGITGFKRNQKTNELVKWIQQNVADTSCLFTDLIVVNINSKLEGIQKKIYTYLMRRDDFEDYYDPELNRIITIPKGAQFKTTISLNGPGSLELRFPDDEITILLDKYGKNRCSDWKGIE